MSDKILILDDEAEIADLIEVYLSNEDFTVNANPDKLVRVFGNILRNAASYSYPGTEIVISAKEMGGQFIISFQNKGNHIPEEELSSIFSKFYRLDKARISEWRLYPCRQQG